VTGTGVHKKYEHTPQQWGLIMFFVFNAYWVLEMCTAVFQFSVAYAVAKYYRSFASSGHHQAVDSCAVLEGTRISVTKHLGSISFGAAIIAVFQVTQRIMEYIERKEAQLSEDSNPCIRGCLACCLGACRCMENIMAFINKNAYIDIAVTGDHNFCRAIRNVAHVIIDFGPAMALLNGATVIFQVVGMAAITCICGTMAFFVLRLEKFADPSSDWHVESQTAAVVLACVVALIVSWSFMDIFDVTTDTLLYCYAKDKLTNGAAVGAPPNMRRLYEDAEARVKMQQGEAPRDRMKYSRVGTASHYYTGH